MEEKRLEDLPVRWELQSELRTARAARRLY